MAERRRICGGGYNRWIVVVAVFFVMFLTDGCTFTFGVLLLEFLEEFGDTRAATAVVGSLTVGVYHLVGPIAALLADLCGTRAVAVMGGVISSAGFLGAAFARNLVTLAACYGVLGGIGFGMLYLPATACVVQHFEDKRALAMGIAVCGAGAGTFTMSHLLRYLIDTYTWRGAVLILAAIELHGIPLGLLLVPKPTTEQITVTTVAGSECREHGVVDSACNHLENVASECNCPHKLPSKLNDSKTVVSVCKDPGKVVLEYKHSEDVASEYRQSEKGAVEYKRSENGALEDEDNKQVACKCKNSGNVDSKCKNIEIKASRSQTVDSNNKIVVSSKIKGALQRCKAGLLENIRLLSDLRCVCFLLSTAVVSLAFMVPFSLLPDQAMNLGMLKDQASWLLSAMGITNIISRIIVGWLSDRKCVNRLMLFGVFLLLAGVTTGVSPLLQTFHTKLVYSCVFGFLIGGYVVLIPVVLADLFGADLIEKSFGLTMLAIGVPAITALPLGGWIADRTGSYTVSFVVAGSELVVSELILYLPWLLQRLRHSRSVEISGDRVTKRKSDNA